MTAYPAVARFLELDGKRTPTDADTEARYWAVYDDRKSTGRIELVGIGKTVARMYLTNSCEVEDLANAEFCAAASELSPELRLILDMNARLRKAVELAAEMTRDLSDCSMSHSIFIEALEGK